MSIHQIKNRLAKLLWRNNQWTKAIDDIENATNELRNGKVEEVLLEWEFAFLKSPPSNKVKCIITLDKDEKDE